VRIFPFFPLFFFLLLPVCFWQHNAGSRFSEPPKKDEREERREKIEEDGKKSQIKDILGIISGRKEEEDDSLSAIRRLVPVLCPRPRECIATVLVVAVRHSQ
jgi:hypothetical protein